MTRGSTLAIAIAAAVSLVGAAAAQPTAVASADMAKLQARLAAYGRLPDTPGAGPYASIKTTDRAFPAHVIYRPANLAALGGHTLPVLVWGNGGCGDDGASQRLFLEDIASYGYLVVAPGAIKSGPGAPPQPPPKPLAPGQLSAATTAEEVRAGLDEAAAADAAPGPLQGRIDLQREAVAGYSCGGLQALLVADDPRIKAVVIMHSGVFKDQAEPIHGIHVEKSVLKTLHTPVIYVMGGPSDIAFPNGSDDFARIETVPALLATHDVGHGGTYFAPNGGEEAMVVRAWLDWQLRGDASAGRMFQGADCGLCRMPGWSVTKKGF